MITERRTGERTYLVAGAGPAGLAAVHRLRSAGHHVRMLESASRAGSKMCSETRDGFVLDRAAVFVTPGYDRIMALAGEVGVLDGLVGGAGVFGLARERRVHEIDGERPVRGLVETRCLGKKEKVRLAATMAPEG